MGLVGYDLSQYPLDEHYEVCRKYMSCLDWDKISEDIAQKGTIGVDVSDVISLFPRLELDPDYRLICYMTSEYHGIFGRVAAIKRSDDWHPKCDKGADFKPHNFGNQLALPECAFPPMEAIFNDGSGEGYFEAVLLSLFLQALPYTHFEQDHWSLIIKTTPDNYEENWDHMVALTNWSPMCSNSTITALSRKVENGIGASDGKDRIYLIQFNFCRSVNDYLLRTVLKTRRPVETNHITDSNRYSETRKCCVFTSSSVLVAVEKSNIILKPSALDHK